MPKVQASLSYYFGAVPQSSDQTSSVISKWHHAWHADKDLFTPDLTIEKILHLKEFLVTKVGLEESVFQGFACSAVALFFTVNRARLPVLIRLLSCHQKALLDFSIVTVFVPGEFFYDVARDQEYPCPKVGAVKHIILTSELYIAQNVVSVGLCHIFIHMLIVLLTNS